MRKIACVGLPKTGTSSLRDALRLLGYQRFSGFVMDDCYRYLHGDIESLVEKFSRHEVVHSWPWPLLYQPLYRAFPDALFILTTRKDDKVWLKSMQGHAEEKRKLTRPPGMRQHIYGYENPADNPEHHIRYYHDHNDAVRRYFSARGQLLELCWESGDEWDKLCAALSLPVPDQPFPHSNKARRTAAAAR